VRGRTVPYFQEIREKPLEFEVEFAFIDSWDNTSIRKIGQWLLKSYYKPLYFSDNPDRIFWAVVVDSPTLVHNSLKQGYVKLKFRCSDAYAYSPIYASPLYDYSSNPVAGTTLTFTNNGDLSLYPEIWITNITANQTVSIFNQSNGNIEFKFVSLNANETVYIDNFNQFITTDVVGQYRYSNFNNNWL
jgi:phage-related protein